MKRNPLDQSEEWRNQGTTKGVEEPRDKELQKWDSREKEVGSGR